MSKTLVTTSEPVSKPVSLPFRNYIIWPVAILCLSVYIIGYNYLSPYVSQVYEGVSPFLTKELFLFVGVGFIAQVIDGALGMAYGVSSTSFLLGMGVPPAMASASVHVAEVFTTGVSGLSHLKLGNVNKKLFQRLVLPGVIGVVAGAYVITSINEKAIKPFIAAYLLIMGIVIIKKAFKKLQEVKEVKRLSVLAVFGGFMDAVGGGGWGPIVASSLLSKGFSPRYTIGSVNLAEFFIALAGAGTFVTLIGLDNWHIIAGLIIGGTVAAPFAAYLCKLFKPQTLMIMVGVLIIGLSIRTLYMFFN